MDEFKPEDELKPDASDRRPSRPRKPSAAAKVPASRQRIMMGVGILVLLLLVLGIGSALNGPDEKKPATAGTTPAASGGSGSEKNIDLGGSSSMSAGQTPPSGQTTPAADANNASTSGEGASAPQRDVSMPPVASTPTQAAPVDAPANQQRVTLPGDLNSALTNQQQQVDNAAMGTQGGSSLPTAPATVSGNAGTAANPVAAPSRQTPNKSSASARPAHDSSHKTASKPATRDSKTHTTSAHSPASSAPATASTGSSSASKSVPGGSYTLQLSGASKAESLNAWAKQQNLSGYHVYKTTRNGQPWYVLVNGSYATPADAKRAVASLPAEVRAKNPWVKPVSQVKKEASQ
ncbi:SPOR domain-containing protein [Pantoea jilinensis]|nr:SPOR domain-containing protein [Pantoea jilinensis]